MTQPNPTGRHHRRDPDDPTVNPLTTDPAEMPMSPETAEATTWLSHDWPNNDPDQEAQS